MSIEAYIGEFLTLTLMAFALGMDAFSVGLGMGMIKLRFRQIFYIGLTVGFFHIWMPLAGMIIGKLISGKLGTIAGYAGGVLLMLLGLQMLLSSFKKDDSPLISPVGFGLFIFATSVSLDSFSVGLTLGIYGAKQYVAIVIFGAVSMLLTWAGLLIGKRVKGWLGKYGEALGGTILFALGLKMFLPF
ncbi:manganese efflux pump MntP family protein [Metabacillus sp. GX 13764]|uniref:manganese efflux pump MntP n=1 Tax=Metabacillus kandeliae TaxID=2900151 RepID=UPI001E388B12|nr:manganese efflux pump [Metabacillus kandeliae]MCD7034677.1 manganese efflux pump MntP family protein [Metabacillus kandeliae]